VGNKKDAGALTEHIASELPLASKGQLVSKLLDEATYTPPRMHDLLKDLTKADLDVDYFDEEEFEEL
jgi:hypothetical protein